MLDENIQYIESLKRFGIRSGLEPMSKLLELLGNPHKKFKSIHVAGTNGKGSTTAMISSIIKEAGYKVGAYFSPYLLKFNERIEINGNPISDYDLERLITKVRKHLESSDMEVTFFEFITAVAFLYFVEHKIDIAVIEVGLGGRLDATNITDSLISVITNIGSDHQQILGNTKSKIAIEKAGIIKEKQICISAEEDPTIKLIFSEICKIKNTELLFVDDVTDFKILENNLEHQKFSAQGIFQGEFELKLLGNHQVRNALTALIVCSKLNEIWKPIPQSSWNIGLKKAMIRGRLEVISKNPLIIVDGAHNLEGILALKRFILGLSKRKVLIMGVSNDKDSFEMVKELAPLFEVFVATEGKYKPKPILELVEEAERFCNNVYSFKEPLDALKKSLELASKDEMILATGSLYMIPEIIKFFDKAG